MEVLEHYGIPRRSGRYPWGSGDQPFQSSGDFLSRVNDLKAKGMTEAQRAEALGMKTPQLRARVSRAKMEERKSNISTAAKFKAKGMSTSAIARRMGTNESTVRGWLDPSLKQRTDVLENTQNTLKKAVGKDHYIDVGVGVERYLGEGISRTKLDTALAALQDEGYEIHNIDQEQPTTGHKTTIKVLCPPGTTSKQAYDHRGDISNIGYYTDDGGKTFHDIKKSVPLSSSRVKVRFAEDGGTDRDGCIELRRGVDDISLGNARYAQVRVNVDGTHYLKGMAMYGDPKEFPKGVDVIYNSNKSKKTVSKMDAMKSMKDDPENPFGAVVRQKTYIGKDGKQHQSVLNIVNEEGAWAQWSRNLPSQMLSKQPISLAKKQLGKAIDSKQQEYDEIISLTNPVIKKKLLMSFADSCDSDAVHLKGAAMPRQMTHAILPFPSMKDMEIYAPNYRDGEKVSLIRFPHGGIFEIPTLTVNNNAKEPKKLLGKAVDAVGINAHVAERLSGADFDGDSVLVIPNDGSVKTKKALAGLKDFNPSERYPRDPKLPKVGSPENPYDKQKQMGRVSNLITDMTIKGATDSEIARAVRHSMVVIDAEKHNLDWKQSEIDNDIPQLKKLYQGGAKRGASTLISRASSEARVPYRKPRSQKNGGPIDIQTGRKMWEETGESYPKTDPRTGKTKMVRRTISSTKMYEAPDAFALSSGTPMETVYASYANKMKAMGNKARKAYISTPSLKYSPEARQKYIHEVSSLNAKLNVALKNAPLERQATVLANSTIRAKMKDNPNMDKDEKKKMKNQAMTDARNRVGAHKSKVMVDITPKEWEAIQAGAISDSKLRDIINNTDETLVKQYATPHEKPVLKRAVVSRIKSMRANGHTQAEIADALGISISSVRDAMNGKV